MNSRLLSAVDFSKPTVNPAAQYADIGSILNQVLPAIMIVASLVCLALMLVGAISYLTSSGEQEKTQKARRTITYSVVGIILIFLSYLIVRLVSLVTGITMFI